jgi:hypothetical protein
LLAKAAISAFNSCRAKQNSGSMDYFRIFVVLQVMAQKNLSKMSFLTGCTFSS